MTGTHATTLRSRPRLAAMISLAVIPGIAVMLPLAIPFTEGWALWQRTLAVALLAGAAVACMRIPSLPRLVRGVIGIRAGGVDARAAGPRPAGSVTAVVASLSLPMLLSSLDTSIANVALPTLATEFNASFQQVQWIVLAYLLATTTLIVSVGRLGDIVGRRRLLLLGIAVFTVASALCGAAPELWMLVAARAVQGLGAAVMMALTMAFVGETVSAERNASAMGVLATMSAVGTALGPSLGGMLIAALGWRSIFLVNLPLGALALLWAYRRLPADRIGRKVAGLAFDGVGTVLLALTLAAYALAMTIRPARFGLPAVALLASALVGAGLFVRQQARAASPLVRLAMFRSPLLGASLASGVFVSTVVMATLVVGPFYLSRALGLGAPLVGLAMSVGPIVAAVTAIPAGRLADRFGARRIAAAGLWGLAAGSFMLAVMPVAFAAVGYLAAIVVITSGYALFQTSNNAAVMAGIGSGERGVVSGLLNLSRNLGLITGASVMGAVFVLASGGTDISAATPADVAVGMRTTFAVAAVLMALALGVRRWGRGARGGDARQVMPMRDIPPSEPVHRWNRP